jgi:hypothetical protein
VSNAQRLPVRSLASWYHRRVGGAREDRKGAKEGAGLLPAATLARDSYLRSALTLLRPLLDGVANASLDPYFATVNVLVTDAAKDEVLMRLWINVGGYFSNFTEPVYSTRLVSCATCGMRSTADHFDAVVDAERCRCTFASAPPVDADFTLDVSKLSLRICSTSRSHKIRDSCATCFSLGKETCNSRRSCRVILPTLVNKVVSYKQTLQQY